MKSEALARLDGIVGEWRLTMTDAWFLESRDIRVPGTSTIEWLDEAFLVWRWSLGDERPAQLVIGYSDANEQYTVLYHDGRGVSRVFRMTWGGGEWTLLREDPDFHQRFVARVGRDRIVASWDASEDAGQSWRKDFDLIFERTG